MIAIKDGEIIDCCKLESVERRDRPGPPLDEPSERGKRGRRCCRTQVSSVPTSGAIPWDAGNDLASSAGTRSMTVKRVSAVVPWRAYPITSSARARRAIVNLG